MEEHLIREFIAEAEEHLLILEPNLLRLEKEPDNLELIQEIFLATHGIKGTAAYVGLPHISSFTHSLETLFDRLRKGELRTSAELMDVLLEGLDWLKLLVNNVAVGKAAPDTTAYEMKLLRWQEQKLVRLGDGEPGRWENGPPARPKLSTAFVLDADILNAIDPEDGEIFADIASQQIEFMRLALDLIRASHKTNHAPVAEQIEAPLQSLSKAFHKIQSSAAVLNSEPLNRVLTEQGRYLAALASPPEILTENHLTQIENAIQILATVAQTISAGCVKETQLAVRADQPAPAAAEFPLGDVAFGQHTLRVNAARVDDLLNLVGELAISRARLAQISQEIKNLHETVRTGEAAFFSPHPLQRKKSVRMFKKLKDTLDEITLDLGRLTNQLQEHTMRIRMIPISQVVSRFPRMVRDLARQAGKDVAIEIYGADTELDKTVVDVIGEPLIHIVRNAIDHGIELPADRQVHGKTPQGKLIIATYYQGNQVVIEVADDGKGIDLERVKQKALQQQLLTPQEAQTISPKELSHFIFHAGFSTVDTVSVLSGRGVGLHVVKRYLERLNGAIELDTIPGKGSKFTLKLPLTLAIIPALLVSVRAELFALPLVSVEEAIRIADQEIKTIGSQKVIRLREKMIPLVELAVLLNVPLAPTLPLKPDMPGEEWDAEQARRAAAAKPVGVIISDGLRDLGLIVDALVGESDIVIKSLDTDLVKVEGVSGASIQGDGQVTLVLDAAALIDLAIKQFQQKTRRSA